MVMAVMESKLRHAHILAKTWKKKRTVTIYEMQNHALTNFKIFIYLEDQLSLTVNKVKVYEDEETDLKSIIAIHSSSKGPAIGGCRYKLYGSYEEGLVDVLRLSKGMTQKNIAANIPFGGGKAVIFAQTAKSPELLRSFASFLNLLDGLYISAEDIGINLEDIQFIKSHSNYVFDNVDPGPYTAKGIFYSIESVIQYYFKY